MDPHPTSVGGDGEAKRDWKINYKDTIHYVDLKKKREEEKHKG